MSDAKHNPSSLGRMETLFTVICTVCMVLLIMQLLTMFVVSSHADVQARLIRQAWEQIAKQQVEIDRLKEARHE